MLSDGNLRTVKSLPFGEVRERAAVPIRRLFFQKGTENAVDLPPAFGNIINLRKKWKGICSQVPFIVLKYRQGCI